MGGKVEGGGGGGAALPPLTEGLGSSPLGPGVDPTLKVKELNASDAVGSGDIDSGSKSPPPPPVVAPPGANMI